MSNINNNIEYVNIISNIVCTFETFKTFEFEKYGALKIFEQFETLCGGAMINCGQNIVLILVRIDFKAVFIVFMYIFTNVKLGKTKKKLI